MNVRVFAAETYASPSRERRKANRDFRDFKGLDSFLRSVPPANGKNMRPPKRKSLEIPAIPVEKGRFPSADFEGKRDA